jgi:hypothetical protein
MAASLTVFIVSSSLMPAALGDDTVRLAPQCLASAVTDYYKT